MTRAAKAREMRLRNARFARCGSCKGAGYSRPDLVCGCCYGRGYLIPRELSTGSWFEAIHGKPEISGVSVAKRRPPGSGTGPRRRPAEEY